MNRIYYATGEFACPAEVIYSQLRLWMDSGWHFKARGNTVKMWWGDQQGRIHEYSLEPADEFIRRLDVSVLERVYETSCACGHELPDRALVWIDGEPVCSACAADFEQKTKALK